MTRKLFIILFKIVSNARKFYHIKYLGVNYRRMGFTYMSRRRNISAYYAGKYGTAFLSRPPSGVLGHTVRRRTLQYSGRIPRNPALIPKPSKGPEVKFVDVALSGISCDTTGVSTLINGIAQGLTDSTRIGNKCKWRSIYVKGVITLGGTPVNSNVKISLLLDKQPTGVVAPLTGADSSTARVWAATSTLLLPYSMLEMNNSNRYTILKDKLIRCRQSYSTSVDQFNVEMFYRFPKGGLDTHYNNTGATIASISSNSLHFVTNSNTAAGASAPLFYGTVRLRYIDA